MLWFELFILLLLGDLLSPSVLSPKESWLIRIWGDFKFLIAFFLILMLEYYIHLLIFVIKITKYVEIIHCLKITLNISIVNTILYNAYLKISIKNIKSHLAFLKN